MPSLAEFSACVQASANRHLIELHKLDAWLEDICKQKLGPASARCQRDAKSAAWIHRVAGKTMIRSGFAQELSMAEAQRASEQSSWARRALETGHAPRRLSLLDSEKDELLAILDWLRGDSGPPLAGDWTRISVKQAAEGRELSSRPSQEAASLARPPHR